MEAVGLRGEQLGEELVVVEQRPPATAAQPRQPVHLRERRAAVDSKLKVQYAKGAGPAARDRDGRVRRAGR